MTLASLLAIIRPPGIEGEQLTVHTALRNAESDWGLLPSGPGNAKIAEIIEGLRRIQLHDAATKGTMARAILVLNNELNPHADPNLIGLLDVLSKDGDALSPNAESSEDIAKLNAALRKLYSAKQLSEEEADHIVDVITSNGARWPLDLAAEHARALSRKPDSSFDLQQQTALGIAGFAAIVVGVVALIFIILMPKALGTPIQGTPAVGDDLGLRFLIFLGTMMMGSLPVGALVMMELMSETTALLVLEIMLIAAVALIVWLPIGGRSYSLKDIGLRSDSIGKDLLYGGAAFLANIPVTLVLALLGLTLLRWIPSGGHPIQNDLLAGESLWVLVITAGPLTALMEELTFRGLLFQGLSLRLRLWPAIAISGLAFAMIHPQGGALWPALAWIGGMAAYLTYRRKSLVPAIFMHTLHNSFLILLVSFTTG